MDFYGLDYFMDFLWTILWTGLYYGLFVDHFMDYFLKRSSTKCALVVSNKRSPPNTSDQISKQNLNAGLLQQHHFWAGLMAIFRVAVLLFSKPKLEWLNKE